MKERHDCHAGRSRDRRDRDAVPPRTRYPLYVMTAKTDRFHVVPPVSNERHPQAGPDDDVPKLDVKSQRSAFVEQMCLALFDRWCEQRNVLALAYLMYGWPLAGDDPSLVRRLVQSLRELGEHHHEALRCEEHALLRLSLDCE
jgi:hypothetical protein